MTNLARSAILLTLAFTIAEPTGAEVVSKSELRVSVMAVSGDPLPGASVSVSRVAFSESLEDAVETIADGTGNARFDNIEPGSYIVEASMPGFLDTRVGPLPVAQNNQSAQQPLVIALNTLARLCPVGSVAMPIETKGPGKPQVSHAARA